MFHNGQPGGADGFGDGVEHLHFQTVSVLAAAALVATFDAFAVVGFHHSVDQGAEVDASGHVNHTTSKQGQPNSLSCRGTGQADLTVPTYPQSKTSTITISII